MDGFIQRLLFLPEAASTFAARVDRLHLFVFSVTMVVALATGTTALIFFVRYRRRSEDQLVPRLRQYAVLELAFIGAPLVMFLLWFAIGFRDFVWMSTPPPDATDIYVMGKQWMWKFSYPEGPNSVDVLRVPAGRPVRLLLTSRDVVHSFFVPAFRVKQDALPGRYTQMWFEATRPGRYDFFCTEYCGTNHSTMLGQVVVMEGEAFDAWLAAQRRPKEPAVDGAPVADEATPEESNMVAQGQRVALQQGCFKCHTVDGAPHIGPSWKDLYLAKRPLMQGPPVVADVAYLTRSMMDPNVEVVAGFQPVMPTFQGQLTATEAAALVEYIKSLRGPNLARAPAGEALYAPIAPNP